jgi:hypothetical protein
MRRALPPLLMTAVLALSPLAGGAAPSLSAGGAQAPLIAGRAAVDPAAVCLATADRAADRHGVPRQVLRALTRTETGRAQGGALQPWAWTVNMEGAGHWFDSRAEALAYVHREQARGARSFDVGCFQINHRWHGEHFASVEAMFDPDANADYAARFMRELYDETGDWSRAAGFYHSRTPEFFNRYRDRFARILARGDSDAGPTDVAALGAPARRELREPALPRAQRERPAAVIWRADAEPAAAGGVQLRILRGGLGMLAGASGPLID